MTVKDAHISDLPKITDPRGNLSFIEQLRHVPFEIKRVYWIYDVPGGCDRGEHAYKESQEYIVALSGSFDVELDDGNSKQTFSLNRSYKGLYVPKGMWRRMTNFSTNSVALVLASTTYDKKDYIMDYGEFKQWSRNHAFQTNSPDTGLSVTIHRHEACPAVAEARTVEACAHYELNKMHDPEGNLTYIYENVHVPFNINRVFYNYDIPGGEKRGAHAHKKCHQLIIAASGAFEVVLDDGVNKRKVMLNRPFWGIHVPPGIWAYQQEFSSGSICLVLASHEYDENDYIRDYSEFLEYKKT